MGVDFGLKRVGLAVCDVGRILATPLPVYRTKSMRNTIDRVAFLAAENGVCAVVVELIDERLTTVEADELLAEAGVKRDKRAELIDSMSATVILQSYIDKYNKRR